MPLDSRCAFVHHYAADSGLARHSFVVARTDWLVPPAEAGKRQAVSLLVLLFFDS